MNNPGDVTIPLEKPAFRWSFSQWETYSQCPAKWKFGSVLKLPRQPPGPAAARGLEIHASVEEYCKHGDASVLHGAIKPRYIPIFDELRLHENGDTYQELKLGFDVDWATCPPQAKTAACIAILDGVRFANNGVAHVYEWKSGKPKDTHPDQRKLYAVASLLKFKATKAVVTTFYLEDTEVPQRTVVSEKGVRETLIPLWNSRIHQMQRDQFCAPKPSFGCNWCDFAKKKGGPCKFGA